MKSFAIVDFVVADAVAVIVIGVGIVVSLAVTPRCSFLHVRATASVCITTKATRSDGLARTPHVHRLNHFKLDQCYSVAATFQTTQFMIKNPLPMNIRAFS